MTLSLYAAIFYGQKERVTMFLLEEWSSFRCKSDGATMRMILKGTLTQTSPPKALVSSLTCEKKTIAFYLQSRLGSPFSVTKFSRLAFGDCDLIRQSVYVCFKATQNIKHKNIYYKQHILLYILHMYISAKRKVKKLSSQGHVKA